WRQPASSRSDARAFSTMSLRNRSNVPGFSRKSTMTTYPPIFFFLCVPIGFDDLVEMGTDGALGPLGVVRGNGFVDRLVGAAGDELLSRPAKGGGPGLGQPGREGLMNRREESVA